VCYLHLWNLVKTLLFLTGGPYFWPEQKTVRLKYELLSEHFDGFIVSFVSRAEWERASIGRFEVIGWPTSGRVYNVLPVRLFLRLLFTLRSTLRVHFSRRRLDVIVASDPFFTGLLAWVLSLITRARFIVEVNNDFQALANWGVRSLDVLTFLKTAYVRLIAPFVLNRAHGVRLLYRTQVAGFRGLRRPEKYACFHDFVATSLYGGSESEPKRILFVGHPWYTKGVDVLLKAFNAVSPEYPDYALRLVGYLPEKEENRVLFEGNPRIEFLGPVMPDAVIRLMSECAVFVLASRSEGMPRVLIEAMVSGKPIIASRVGGIPHYIQHGETGLLFDRDDVEALTRLLRDVLASSDYRRALGEKARRYAREQLSDRRYADGMVRLVEAVAGGDGAPPRR
jgi:glycosyltransferase involved in cell wall biosynthesis